MTEGQAEKVNEHFDVAVKSLKGASFALRNCYCIKNPSLPDFCTFRDECRDLGLIFKDGLYPVSCETVSGLKSFMDYYVELDFEDWKEALEDIIPDARHYETVLRTLTTSYTTLSTDFKSKQDYVARLKEKILLEHKAQLATEAARMKSSGNAEWWGDFVQVCTLGVTDGGNHAKAEQMRNEAIAAKAESQLCLAACDSVKNHLVPALANFVQAMTEISGFFNVLTHDVKDFADTGEKALEERKKTHWRILKAKGKRIQDSCSTFLFVAPDFISDLDCIPHGNQPNFVQEWLAKKNLQKEWSAPEFKKLAKPMLKAVENGASTVPKGSRSVLAELFGF